MGFDGLQYTELYNWKGNTEDPAWQSLVTAIERAITPTYVERLMARKNDELYTARLLRDTVVDRKSTFEKQIVEAEQARLEATTRERKSGLELIDVSNKLNEATAKVTQLEASTEAVRRQLTEAEAARKEARDALDENSSRLIEVSRELADEKALRALQRAKPARTGLRFTLGHTHHHGRRCGGCGVDVGHAVDLCLGQQISRSGAAGLACLRDAGR